MSYPPTYFDQLAQESWSSARTIVPLVLDHVHVESVVDVGCATGIWLSVFQENGVSRVMGLDGAWIDRSRLLVPSDCFRAVDLAEPFHCEAQFDLAVCLEVAEHLPEKSASRFVESLCQLAPVVLFSAAVPGQHGVHHVNGQWPEYWRQRFVRNGYRMFDSVRPLVWHDDSVAYYYRQNMFLFISERFLATHPELCELPEVKDENELLLVAPYMMIDRMGFFNVLKRLPGLFFAGIKGRLAGFISW